MLPISVALFGYGTATATSGVGLYMPIACRRQR